MMKNIEWNKVPNQDEFVVTIKEQHPYFFEHCVRGRKVLPGVAYLDIVAQAVRQMYPDFIIKAFEDGLWLRPIVCHEVACTLNILLSKEPQGIAFKVMVDSELCGAGLVKSNRSNVGQHLSFEQADDITNHAVRRISRSEVYQAFAEMGIDYGRYFRRINYVDVHENKSVSLLSNNDGVQLSFVNLLDAAFQSGMAISIGEHQESLMPFSLGAIHFHGETDITQHHSYYVITEKKSAFRTNITICDDRYQTLLSVHDLGVKPSLLSKN